MGTLVLAVLDRKKLKNASRCFVRGLDRFRHLRFERLGGIRHDLALGRAYLARLACVNIELIADEGGLQFHDLPDILGTRQALGKIEAQSQAPLGTFHPLDYGSLTQELTVEGHCPLTCHICCPTRPFVRRTLYNGMAAPHPFFGMETRFWSSPIPRAG